MAYPTTFGGYQYPTEESMLFGGREEEEEEEKPEEEIVSYPPNAPTGYGSLPPGMTLTDPSEAPQAAGLPEGMVLLDDNGNPLSQQVPPPPTPEAYDIPHYGDLYPSLAKQREHLVLEIDANPQLREYAAAAISQEGRGEDTVQAIVESLFNRTVQRRSSIQRQLTNGFYGPVKRGEVDAIVRRGVEPWMYEQFDRALDAVRNGSDFIEGRTDQGMYDEIIGPKTKYGSEWFGYMGGDPTWSIQHQRNKGEPGPATHRGRGEEAGLPPGMKILKEGEEDASAGLPPGMKLIEEGKEGEPQRGLDAAIAEAKDAGLTVTSGYRGPEHELSKKYPRSAHTQGLAFDLRARTGAEADEVMAKQREIFTSRGMQEGRDYKFIDEVRNPSGHATGPHVHVQMTEGGIGYYSGQGASAGLPPGMKLVEEEEETAGLPPGMKLVEGGEAAPAPAPAAPAAPMQTLPSGEMAPTAATGQEEIRASEQMAREPIEETVRTPLPEVSAAVARQMGLERWIDQDTGMEVRRAEMAEGGLPVYAQAKEQGAGQLGINMPVTRAEAALAEAAGKPYPEALLPKEEEKKPSLVDLMPEAPPDTRREVGTLETANRVLASTNLGYEQLSRRIGQYPMLRLIHESVKAIAPDSDLAKYTGKLAQDSWNGIQAIAKEREKLAIDPKKEKQGLLAEITGATAPLAVDIPIAVMTGGAGKLATNAGTLAKYLHSAAAFVIPGAKTGMDAAQEVAKKGGSEVDQFKAFLAGSGETMGIAAVPAHMTSAANNVAARLIERAGKGGITFALINEGVRDLKNIYASATGGEHIKFNAREAFVGAAPGVVLGAGMGGREAPRREPSKGRPYDILQEREAREAWKKDVGIVEVIEEGKGKIKAAAKTARDIPIEVETQQRRIAEINDEINEITKKETPEEGDAKKIGDLVQEAISLSEKVEAAEGKPAEAPKEAAPEPAKAAEPVEPTHEIERKKSNFVRDSAGNRGTVVSEKEGNLEVEWDRTGEKSTVKETEVTREDTQNTINKNTVMIIPSKKGGGRVIHYDENGRKVSDTDHSIYSDAVSKAEKLTKDNNLSGYFDVNDKFVRERGKARELAPERELLPEDLATEYAPGMTPEQIARFEAAAKPVPDTWVDKLGNTVRRLVRGMGFTDVEPTRVKNTYSVLAAKYNAADLRLVTQRLKDTRIGGERVEDILNNNLPFFERPVSLTFQDKVGDMRLGPAGVTIDPRNGQVYLNINPRELLADLESTRSGGFEGAKKSGKDVMDELFHKTLVEEMVHVAQHTRAWTEWEGLSPAERQAYDTAGRRQGVSGFRKFQSKRSNDALSKAKGARDGLSQDQQAIVDQAWVDGVNTYETPMMGDRPFIGYDTSRDAPSGIYSFLRDKLDVSDPRIMMEVMRQMLQYRRDGKITEQTLAETAGPITQFYQGTIDRLEQALARMFRQPSTPEGAKVREALKEELDAWDKILNDKDLKRAEANNVTIESLTTGTPELSNFLGQSVIKDTVMYHVHKDDFGTHVGTAKLASDQFFNQTQGPRRGKANGFVTYPMFGRFERPMYLGDHVDWQPERVAADAVRRGYVVAGELDVLRRRDGSLTHANLKDLFQKKGYDSIAYINEREGRRLLTGDEIENRLKSSKIESVGGRWLGTEGDYSITDPGGNRIGRGRTPEQAWGDARVNLSRSPQAIDHSYIAFEPNQLKSAKGNEGAYNLYDQGIVGRKKREQPSLESRIVDAHNRNGGSSISPIHGDVAGKDFFSVEVYPELTTPVNGKKLTVQDIYDLRNKALRAGADLNDPYKIIGTWVNEKGNTEMGVSALIPDLHAALDIAKEYGQRAIWDNAVGGEIFINGVMPQTGGLPALNERVGFVSRKGREIEFPKLKISLAEVERRAEAQAKWKDWYDTYDRFMRNDFVPKNQEYHPLFTTMMAATSPMRFVKQNVGESMQAMRNFVLYGDARGIEGKPGWFKFKGHGLNLSRLSRGEAIEGEKVAEFLPASMGDPYAIAVDRHVGNVLFGTEAPSDLQKFSGQRAIMRVAERMGWKWSEVQAALFADDIIRKGKGVERYEWFLEQHREEFAKLVHADLESGGKGSALGRSILERVSAREGPEKFLRTSAGNIALIREARAAAVDPTIAASVSLTGPKLYGPNGAEVMTGRKGRDGSGKNMADIPTTEFDSRVASAFRLRRMYDGVKHVFWNSPGLQGLGNAVHHHADLQKKLIGEYTSPFFQWTKEFGAIARARGFKKAAINEHQEYRFAKAAGEPLPGLSPEALKLGKITDDTMAKVNATNKRLGIKVQHPDTGKWVPIPELEYPAQIKESVLEAMRHPNQNRVEWNDLVDGWKAEGILPKDATQADAVRLRDKVLSAHDKNGVFSRFLFSKDMPKTAFDYSYKSMTQFLNTWTERVAQVEAFGQTRESDIFTHAIERTHDKASKNYIETVQRLAYGDEVTDVWGRFSTSAGQWASIAHLANWASATKNLIYGQAFNMQSLGLMNYTKAFFQVNPFKIISSAVEKGIIVRDLTNVMTYGENVSNFRGAAGRIAFKISGWNLAENWNRGVAFVGSQSLLRDALNAYDKNPRSGKTLRYMGYFKRLGLDGEALLKENGKGERTDEFFRAAVNEIQGGYTYADVPVYMSTPAGKALFKYQKWGAEQSRHFMREVLHPAARTVGLAKKETVEVTMEDGTKQTVQVPRSVAELMPLARYFFIVGAAGAASTWALEQMFGTPSKIVSLAEALAQYREKEGPEQFAKFAEMVWGYHLQAGSMGALGQYIQGGLSFRGVGEESVGNKLANATSASLPSLDPLLQFVQAFKTYHDQGWKFGAKDVDRLAESIGMYRTGKQFALHQMDAIGFPTRYSEALANRQDMVRVKAIQKRYAKDKEYTLPEGPKMAPPKTEISIWREPLDEAIASGDIDGAIQIIERARDGMSPQRWELEKGKLKAHIKAKDPIDPLGRGEAAKPDFWIWAEENLSTYDQEMLRRVQDTYKETAQSVGLGVKWEKPSLEDIRDLRREIEIRAEPMTY